MTAYALFQQLHAGGVALEPAPDGTLRCRAPTGILTPELLDAIRQHKAALLALLEEFGERAAIAQYCGGLSREAAEALAWEWLVHEEMACLR